MGLSVYVKKRDFKRTPEPSGKKVGTKKELIFVVQKHHATQLHYDFRLEHRGVLKSWAVPKGPPLKPKDRRLAVMVEDHPYAYKDFAGRIPEGEYGAGIVKIWDKGTYKAVSSIDQGLRSGHLTIVLRGKKLKGEYALVRFKPRRPSGSGSRPQRRDWLLIKARKKP